MQAWNGFLSTSLESACGRIEHISAVVNERDYKIRELAFRASNRNIGGLEKSIADLQAEVGERDETIAQMQEDRVNGKPVEMPEVERDVLQSVREAALHGLPRDEKQPAELAAPRAAADDDPAYAADVAAMPNWSFEPWFASLEMQKIVTDSILIHVRGSQGGEGDPKRELAFLNALGERGSVGTVVAMLSSGPMLENIARTMWEGIMELRRDLDEESRFQAEEASERVGRLEEENALLQLAIQNDDTLGEGAEPADAEAADGAAAHVDVDGADDGAVEAVDMAEAYSAGDDQGGEAARPMGTNGSRSSPAVTSARSPRGVLDDVSGDGGQAVDDDGEGKGGHSGDDEQYLEVSERADLGEGVQADEAATPIIKQQSGREWHILKGAMALEAHSRRLRNQLPNARLIHDAIKVGTNATQLTYGAPAIYYRGLAKLVGRAGADAGDSDALMALMKSEHTERADSLVEFVTPNFYLTTNSQIEWWVVADPDKGLGELGLVDWPREQRLAGELPRQLHPPRHFEPVWSTINSKLEDVGETRLHLHGFVALRLYTGPMFTKYNTVLRGVSVAECKAPLEERFLRLCHGNVYANTLHSMTASINKLARISMASTVYRAPGGVLPKSFWEQDAAGICGGVEMSFMSTSSSYSAAREYAMRSHINLIFEIKQGMVARGADVSWLSQYPKEEEVLFSPLTAMEVHKQRVDRSTLIVELRPSTAPAALTERSIEEQVEFEHLKREKAAREAAERKEAVRALAQTRSQWYNSMIGLKSSVVEAKSAQAELDAARSAVKAAESDAIATSEHERAELAEKEKTSTAQALTALRKMMAMETEERKAKADKEAAALTVERSMVKARQLSDYLKIAAARQQLSSTKSTFAAALAAHEDSLKDRDAQSSEEVSKHIQIKESMAAMLVATSIKTTMKQKAAADELHGLAEQVSDYQSAAEAREVEINELVQSLEARVDNAVAKEATATSLRQRAEARLEMLTTKYACDVLEEVGDITDPVSMAEKLEAWLDDPRTVGATADKITDLIKTSKNGKEIRKKLATIGVSQKLLQCMKNNPEMPVVQDKCCEALGVLLNTPEHRQKIVDAGGLPVFVRAIRRCQQHAMTVLLKIATSDPALRLQAKEAGASEEWLMKEVDDLEED